jgi:hypothetical protein
VLEALRLVERGGKVASLGKHRAEKDAAKDRSEAFGSPFMHMINRAVDFFRQLSRSASWERNSNGKASVSISRTSFFRGFIVCFERQGSRVSWRMGVPLDMSAVIVHPIR